MGVASALWQFNYLYNFPIHENKDISVLSYPGAGDVWFSLNGTTYQNNSLVTLKGIGDTALLCETNVTTCCKRSSTGNWFFPNKTRVPSNSASWDFYRDRAQMVVQLHRRRGGEDGIYRCEIPDSVNVTQNIYIGVYITGTGEWHCTLISFQRSTAILMLQQR